MLSKLQKLSTFTSLQPNLISELNTIQLFPFGQLVHLHTWLSGVGDSRAKAVKKVTNTA